MSEACVWTLNRNPWWCLPSLAANSCIWPLIPIMRTDPVRNLIPPSKSAVQDWKHMISPPNYTEQGRNFLRAGAPQFLSWKADHFFYIQVLLSTTVQKRSSSLQDACELAGRPTSVRCVHAPLVQQDLLCWTGRASEQQVGGSDWLEPPGGYHVTLAEQAVRTLFWKVSLTWSIYCKWFFSACIAPEEHLPFSAKLTTIILVSWKIFPRAS